MSSGFPQLRPAASVGSETARLLAGLFGRELGGYLAPQEPGAEGACEHGGSPENPGYGKENRGETWREMYGVFGMQPLLGEGGIWAVPLRCSVCKAASPMLCGAALPVFQRCMWGVNPSIAPQTAREKRFKNSHELRCAGWGKSRAGVSPDLPISPSPKPQTPTSSLKKKKGVPPPPRALCPPPARAAPRSANRRRCASVLYYWF